MKKPSGIMELWDAIKRNNICIMTVSEGKEMDLCGPAGTAVFEELWSV